MAHTPGKVPEDDYSAAVKRAIDTGKRVTVRKGRKKVAAVVPIEDLHMLEHLEDRLDVLEALEAVDEAAKVGGVISWDEFEEQLTRS